MIARQGLSFDNCRELMPVRLDLLQSENQSQRLQQLYFCNTESTSRGQLKDDLATDVSFVSLGVSTK
jgi:hypothetical protein